MSEKLVQKVSDICSVVDVTQRKLVGIRVGFDAESRNNVFKVARKYISNGTAALLEAAIGNENPAAFLGVARDIRGAGRLSYIVGVEVASLADLPEGLPEGADTCLCPAGRFARIAACGDQMAAYEYFVTDFRKETPYVCDTVRLPCHVYDSDGKLALIYEPIRLARHQSDRFGSIHWEIVTLPPVRFAGIKRDAEAGDDVIGLYFGIQQGVLSLPCATNYAHEYIGFPYRESGRLFDCFGSQVDGFEGIPEGVETITMPGGLFVHLMTHEMNGDNPCLALAARDKVLADIADRYSADADRDCLFRFHLGTSASLYVPILPR